MAREIESPELRVLVVSPYPPGADGIGAHTRMLATAWLSAGHEVHVLARADKTPSSHEDGIHVHRVLALSRRSFKSVRGLVAEIRPNLVLTQFAVSGFGMGWPPAMSAVEVARRLGATSVIAYHEVVRDLDLLRRPGLGLYRTIARHGDRHVAFSPSAAAALRRALGRDVTALPLGVPHLPPRSEPEVDRVCAEYGVDSDTVVALGFTHPDKGTDVLVEAAAQAAAEGSPVRLLIAGTVRKRSGALRVMEPRDNRFSARVRARAVGAPGVTFHGFVPDEDLPQLLMAVGALALPYRKVTQSGVAGLALAAGLPCVASDLPGLREVLSGAALYAAPGDSRALADQLRRLADVDVRRQLAQESLRRGSKMNCDRVAEALLGGVIDTAECHTLWG